MDKKEYARLGHHWVTGLWFVYKVLLSPLFLLLMKNHAGKNHFSLVYSANFSPRDISPSFHLSLLSPPQSSNLLCSNNFPSQCSCQMASVLCPLSQPPLRTAAIVIAVNTSWLWTHSWDPNLMLSIRRGLVLMQRTMKATHTFSCYYWAKVPQKKPL